MLPSQVTTRPMVECSRITFSVPRSAASVRETSSGNHGVVTIRSSPFSNWPAAPGTIYPTQSMSRTDMETPSMSMATASSGTNFGSAVMMVRPEPLWGSSSRARSRR